MHHSTRPVAIVPNRGLLMSLAGAALFATPALAQDPDVIRLPSAVRDFHAAHADFNATPSGGNGHYAGNVNLVLGTELVPEFAGTGFRVAMEWNNKDSQPIAPHMFRGSSPGAVLTANPVTPSLYGVLDSWDSTAGPYGGTNVGPAPIFLDGSPMPILPMPTSLPASQGNQQYNNPVTLTTDMHYNSLTIRDTMTIDGNIVIYCDDEFYMHTHSAIELAPDATLDIYFQNSSSTWNHIELNANTANPRLVRMFNLGTDTITLHNHSEVYAQIFSPNADLQLTNHGALFGTFHGQGIQFGDHGHFHVDAPVRADACGVLHNDILGVAGATSTGGVTSAATFAEWYNDLLGTNISTVYMLEMTRDDDGTYEAMMNEFHPIDDQLFGNEGLAHNYFFTMEFNADFIYDACQGQFLEFSGADDVWVFVGDDLVLDIGGVVPGTSQVVEMDRLGLVDGDAQQVRFFYAQRQTTESGFNLRTNVVLQPPTWTVAGTAGFD